MRAMYDASGFTSTEANGVAFSFYNTSRFHVKLSRQMFLFLFSHAEKQFCLSLTEITIAILQPTWRRLKIEQE